MPISDDQNKQTFNFQTLLTASTTDDTAKTTWTGRQGLNK